MKEILHSAKTWTLRNGNPPGNPNRSPRCGAITRHFKSGHAMDMCRAPGMKMPNPPLASQRHKLLGSQPGQPLCRLGLRVCPVRNAHRRTEIRYYAVLLKFTCQLGAVLLVALDPGAQVLVCGDSVALLVIATPVSQHEVVAEIGRIPRPGNEVVHLRRVRPERAAAVEAFALLKVFERWPDRRQAGSLATKQELAQVGRLADQIEVLLAHVAKPRATHEI
jgi:hypothetical protein